MARLHDSNGVLLGGLETPAGQALTGGPFPAGLAATLLPTHLNPKCGPEETISGLECSYGTFAYSYSTRPNENVSERSRRPGCHNPVEAPQERHHCDLCGGDYCSVHAAPAAHDCGNVIHPQT